MRSLRSFHGTVELKMHAPTQPEASISRSPVPGLLILLLSFAAIHPALAQSPVAQTSGPSSDAREECPTPGAAEAAVLSRIDPSGDLHLADGRVLRVLHLHRPPELSAPGWPAPAARLRIVLAGSTADRWGRMAARISVLEGTGENAPSRDLALNWLSEGLGIVRPEEKTDGCLPALLAAESQARAHRRGVWADPAFLGQAEETAGLLARSGRYVVIQGRVKSVGERARRTYLNFSKDWHEDLTVVAEKPVWDALRERGMTARNLTGKMVRVRGLLQSRDGPWMLLASPAAIEMAGE